MIIIIILIIIIVIIQYSKFQFKICFNEIIGFLNKSTPLNTRFAAKTHLAVGEFLLVAKNKEWFLKLRKGTLIPVASKRDGQHFRPEKTEDKNNASKKVFCRMKCEALNFLKNLHK
jgi:hypothetical protein